MKLHQKVRGGKKIKEILYTKHTYTHIPTLMDAYLCFDHVTFRNGEGNGNPLQRSCLENPRDGEAWWAAVHWVAQSQTRLKRLSRSSSSIDI